MVSYEVSIGLIIMNLLCVTGSLNLRSIVEFQEEIWFIVPFSPLFILFFISSLAETNRTPFDLPEAEGELVAGFNVEYSSTSFALFFIGEYTNIFFMATLSVFFFFGGWLMPDLSFLIPVTPLDARHVPSLVYHDMQFLHDIMKIFINLKFRFVAFIIMPQVYSIAMAPWWILYIIIKILMPIWNLFWYDFIRVVLYALYLLKPLVVAIKINILVFFFLWIRASVPRYRYDMLMSITWKVFLPLAFVFLIITAGITSL